MLSQSVVYAFKIIIIFGLAVLGWQNTCESADDIAATVAALNTEIDISVLYRGLDPKNKHNLVSVVCISLFLFLNTKFKMQEVITACTVFVRFDFVVFLYFFLKLSGMLLRATLSLFCL